MSITLRGDYEIVECSGLSSSKSECLKLIAAVFSLAERVPDSEPSMLESVLETIGVVVAYLVTDEPVAIPTPVWLSVYPEQR